MNKPPFVFVFFVLVVAWKNIARRNREYMFCKELRNDSSKRTKNAARTSRAPKPRRAKYPNTKSTLNLNEPSHGGRVQRCPAHTHTHHTQLHVLYNHEFRNTVYKHGVACLCCYFCLARTLFKVMNIHFHIERAFAQRFSIFRRASSTLLSSRLLLGQSMSLVVRRLPPLHSKTPCFYLLMYARGTNTSSILVVDCPATVPHSYRCYRCHAIATQ